MTQAQLAWYRSMEERGELVQVRDADRARSASRPVVDGDGDGPIGYVLSLEGADSLVTIGHLERAYAQGLRAVGPGHYGPGVYAQGTNAQGDLGERGRELVREMDRLGMILDATHLCDESFRDALDHFRGPVWASHSNCRSLVNHNRQFNDDQIRELIERGAVIGAAFDAWMIVPGWVRGESTPRERRRHARTGDRSHRSHLPDRRQRAAIAASDPTSTAASAASSARQMSRRSPTCRSSRPARRARLQRRRRRAHRARQLYAVPAPRKLTSDVEV